MPWGMGFGGMGAHMGSGMGGMMANNSNAGHYGDHDEDMMGHCMNMMNEMMQTMHHHGEERMGEGRGWGVNHWGCEARTWNGTATVVWADPALRLLGLQLEDGRNVTVKLAKAYVRASDGALVYGGWLAGAAQAEGTVWVKIAGHDGRGLVVEIDVAGQAYIIPPAYGRG